MGTMGAEVKKSAYVRLATKADVPAIKLLIEAMAEFEKLSHECHATESALESTLFTEEPFVGTTVFMLEIAALRSAPPKTWGDEGGLSFEEKYVEVSFTDEVEDPESAAFRSPKDATRTVVGFVLFFPNYPTFLAKQGLYIEDLYVRKAFRRQGLGTLLLSTVAEQAVKRGFGRVNWSVLDWNVNAIKFYEGMGAVVHQEWRTCRLSGSNLQSYGTK